MHYIATISCRNFTTADIDTRIICEYRFYRARSPCVVYDFIGSTLYQAQGRSIPGIPVPSVDKSKQRLVVMLKRKWSLHFRTEWHRM